MKLIAKVLGWLVVPVATATVLAYAVSATLLRPEFVIEAATKAKLPAELIQTLPAKLTQAKLVQDLGPMLGLLKLWGPPLALGLLLLAAAAQREHRWRQVAKTLAGAAVTLAALGWLLGNLPGLLVDHLVTAPKAAALTPALKVLGTELGQGLQNLVFIAAAALGAAAMASLIISVVTGLTHRGRAVRPLRRSREE